MSKYFIIDDESYKKFQAALMLTGEEEDVVLRGLIEKYTHKVFASVMGKATEEKRDTNNQVNVANFINADEQKQLFINWFRSLTRNGKLYNPVTISGYAGRIENACKDPVFATVPVKNLFTITELDKFISIQKEIKACAGYEEFDARSHSGFTASLKKYEEFLKFQAGDDEDNVLRGVNVIGKATEEKQDTNNQVNVANFINADEQKQLFINWFRSLTRNGKQYNPVTISGYAGRIENACKDPVFATVPVKNLFTITELDKFISIQKEIKACAGYEEFDARSHSGFTASLKKYEEFLKFQAGGNAVSIPFTEARSYYKSSTIHRWTMEEDEICCRRFLECYVINKSNVDTVKFLQMLAGEVPEVSEGSLRMKIQNIKYLTEQGGISDTSNFKCLSQHSMQCKKAFDKALKALNISV